MNETIATHVSRYVHSLRLAGHPPQRVATNERQLDYFLAWASLHGILLIEQLTGNVAERYYDHLLHENDLLSDRLVGPRIRRERLTKLRRLLAFLHLHGITAADLSRSVPILDQHGTRKHAPTTESPSTC